MTPQQQAQAELAKRELARREIARRQNVSQQQGKTSLGQSIKQSISSTLPSALPAGISTAVDTVINKPEVLPAAGQSLGGMATGFTGAGVLGATAGAMVGQAGKQAIEYLKGGYKPNIGEVGKEGLITGLVEGATRGLGRGIFRRQYTNKALQELGGKLGEMKKAFGANKTISVPSEAIYMKLKGAMDDVAVASGPQSSMIKKWLSFMERNPNLTSKNLMELESDLGEVANYGVMKKGAFIQPSNIKKPVVNAIAKEGRTDVSNIVDDLAEQSGQKGFGKVSKKVSKILSNPESHDITKTSGGVISRLIAAIGAGGLTRNPFASVPVYYGLQAIQSPELRNLAFKGIESGGGKVASQGARTTLAELARKRVKK